MESTMRARYLLIFTTLLIASPAMAESWVNEASHFCLDTDGVAANGAAVRMWRCEPHPNQTWKVSPVAGGSFRLINRSSNFCLDTDGSARNGGLVQMWGCVDHPNQLWEIQNLPAGQYRLRNRASGFCLDTDGAAANGGKVQVWQCVNHPNQSWKNFGSADELGRISRTEAFGGPGGGPFELVCPDASFMTGVRARSGAWIDAVSPICSRWVGRQVLGEIDNQPFTGGGGGGESFIRCHGPRGVVVGVEMFQANNGDRSVGHIIVNCGDIEQPTQFANKLPGSADFFGQATATPRMEARCGWGLVAAGIHGRSGAFVDRLGLLCRRAM
jgi:hypothetical protein